MVVGLDKFRDYFAAFADRYVLIGGAACDLLFTDAGLPMRATKDLDIVLCVEVIDAAFATQSKAFLDAGGYQTWSTGDGERRFFRFQNPTDGTFPAMIEVFARPPASFDLPDSDRYIRLSVEEAIVSLSALLLNPDYYAALQDGREMRDGISLLNENLLIPFKARAYLDLTERRAAGEAISSTDIKNTATTSIGCCSSFRPTVQCRSPTASRATCAASSLRLRRKILIQHRSRCRSRAMTGC
jgi:hypothetical protein